MEVEYKLRIEAKRFSLQLERGYVFLRIGKRVWERITEHGL